MSDQGCCSQLRIGASSGKPKAWRMALKSSWSGRVYKTRQRMEGDERLYRAAVERTKVPSMSKSTPRSGESSLCGGGTLDSSGLRISSIESTSRSPRASSLISDDVPLACSACAEAPSI